MIKVFFETPKNRSLRRHTAATRYIDNMAAVTTVQRNDVAVSPIFR